MMYTSKDIGYTYKFQFMFNLRLYNFFIYHSILNSLSFFDIRRKDVMEQTSEGKTFDLNGHEIRETILYVNGKYVRKSQAVISVYDSGFQHGDGVYEGIRAYDNRIFMLHEHVKRLYESCKSLDIYLERDVPYEQMIEIVKETVRRNIAFGVHDIHMRLQATRGVKCQTGMHPNLNVTPCSVVICVDEKPPIFNKQGVKLITSTLRRYPPHLLDPKIHSCNQLNQIMAATEALRQGADEAIMLDMNGFVAETNSATLLMVKDGELLIPTTDCILVSITRKIVMAIAAEHHIPCVERNVSVSEFYNADEAFICGTVGEIAPVCQIDGKAIGKDIPGPITARLALEYRKQTQLYGVLIDEA